MSQNSTPSYLDSPQIIKRVYEEADDAVRVKVASGTSFAVALDAADGDNVFIKGSEDGTTSGTSHVFKLDANGVVYVRADSISGNTAALSSASVGVVLAAIASSGIKSYQIYAQVTGEDVAAAGLTSNITARIDISPATSGSNFFQTSTTLNVPGTTALNAVVASSLLTNIIGKRVQLTLTANNLAGADRVVFYLVGSSL